ncbi:putative secreted protein [Mycolicibacterium rhodesiae JS60]|nr:putative secreted protein [Mycolicibacterium rhodesiae JS60]
MSLRRRVVLAALALALVTGCSSNSESPTTWVDDEVTFVADGLTIHGTYRHEKGNRQAPAALLISESGRTDRNGDNNVAGPIGNMRQLAGYLSDHGVASLRYDKVGTGQTGLGPYADHPADVGSAVYTTGAKAAVRFLAGQSGTDSDHISVYALGEGTVHAMALADDTSAGAPKIHALGLLQPLAGRYLDLITNRVKADVAAAVKSGQKNQQQADQTLAAWNAAVAEVRTKSTVPDKLPDGLNAIVNPGNVKAVAEADAIDPLDLAARIPAGTPVLLTCSDSDGQANCADSKPLVDALGHTSLSLVELKGVNHVLRDDPTDNVGNYSKPGPLSPQLTAALDGFVNK